MRFIYLCFVLFLCGCHLMNPNQPGNLVPATVDQDSSLPSFPLKDTLLHLETMGNPDNPVIIFLHGGPGNDYLSMTRLADEFEGVRLSDNYYLVFWDQRGSGLSQRQNDPKTLSLDQYLADLEYLVDSFAPGRQVILFGHSWGGQYAAQYMNAHPDRIAGAVLFEPGEFSTALGRKMESSSVNFLSEVINDFLWIRQFFSVSDHEMADYLYLISLGDPAYGADRHNDPSPNWRISASVLQFLYFEELVDGEFDFTLNLGKVKPEILFIAGGLSTEMGEGFQKHQAQLFKRARVEVVPDAGHSDVTWSKGDVSMKIVNQYLATLDLSGARK